jgi:hypothetical protein
MAQQKIFDVDTLDENADTDYLYFMTSDTVNFKVAAKNSIVGASENILGGSSGGILIQEGDSQTGFLTPPSAPLQALINNSNNVIEWSGAPLIKTQTYYYAGDTLATDTFGAVIGTLPENAIILSVGFTSWSAGGQNTVTLTANDTNYATMSFTATSSGTISAGIGAFLTQTSASGGTGNLLAFIPNIIVESPTITYPLPVISITTGKSGTGVRIPPGQFFVNYY